MDDLVVGVVGVCLLFVVVLVVLLVDMPGIIKGKVIGGRNLPVMDASTQSTDAYCDVSFAKLDTLRSPTVRKSLNPDFNFDFRFEVFPLPTGTPLPAHPHTTPTIITSLCQRLHSYLSEPATDI